jgi:serine/threonine protein kinase
MGTSYGANLTRFAKAQLSEASRTWPSSSDQNIGPYKVLDSLGAGGMGEVYLARDNRLGRKIALKFLSVDFTKDEERVRRFSTGGASRFSSQPSKFDYNL